MCVCVSVCVCVCVERERERERERETWRESGSWASAVSPAAAGIPILRADFKITSAIHVMCVCVYYHTSTAYR
jgi:hypothetical protein